MSRRPAPPRLARGQGSTFYDKRDGRCVLEHRVLVDGKVRTFRERGESWPEVEEMRDARREELLRRSRLAGDGSTTVASAVADWIENEAHGAPGTMRNYWHAFRTLEASAIGSTPLVDLRVKDCDDLWHELATRKRGRTWSKTTLGDLRSVLARAVDRAVRRELVEANVVRSSVITTKARGKGSPSWLDRDGFARMRTHLTRPGASTHERALLVTLLVGRTKFYEHVNAGRLPAYELEGQRGKRYRTADLDRLLRRSRPS